jgi:hypothetical protein
MKNRTNINPAQFCTCATCYLTAVSIPGTKHRRCGGAAWKARLPKRKWSRAGTWQAGVIVEQQAA